MDMTHDRPSPVRQLELRRSRRAGGAARDGSRPARGGDRRGRRPRRHLRPVQGPAAALRRRARDRHADQRGGDHGRRRRHGAGRACARWSRCGWSTSRSAAWTNWSTRPPRTASCSAARAACRWSRACRAASGTPRRRSIRSRSRPGSRTCRGWWWSARRRRRTTIGLLRAAMQCGDPVVYIEHKALWGLRGPVDETVTIPLGKAARLREGDALTLVSWGKQMHACAEACDSPGRPRASRST